LSFASQPGRVFHGKVDSILPQLDPTTRTLKVRVQLVNPDHALKPEMYGMVELRIGGSRRLLIPQEAVLNSGLKQVVFVDRGNGYLEQRVVKLGKQFGDRVEIVGGLKAGERVATSGNFLIDSEAQLRASAEHDQSTD
jgi:Cu(I)/Ag(I) efflux system membrane fusion protein